MRFKTNLTWEGAFWLFTPSGWPKALGMGALRFRAPNEHYRMLIWAHIVKSAFDNDQTCFLSDFNNKTMIFTIFSYIQPTYNAMERAPEASWTFVTYSKLRYAMSVTKRHLEALWKLVLTAFAERRLWKHIKSEFCIEMIDFLLF